MGEVFKDIKWFFKQEYKKYIFLAIGLLFLSLSSVLPTKVLGLAIDEIADGTIEFKRLVIYVLCLLLIPLTRYFVAILYHYNINSLSQKLSFELRDRYIDHLFEMDANFYAKYTKGDLIARVSNDLQQLTVVATSFLQTIVFNSGIVISSILIMFITINPWLALASISIMPFAIFFLNKLRRQKRQYYKIHHDIYANMTENVLESIEGAKTVRAYSHEEEDYEKTKESIVADNKSWRYILKFENMFTPLFELVYASCYFIAFALGSYMVIKSQISAGDLVTFVMYVGTLYSPLIELSNVLYTINNATVANQRFQDVMKEEAVVKDEKDAKDVFTFNKIEFKNVSFTYPQDNLEVIHNINLEIKKGETIGIVGPTGGGKSTLIRQLLREFNVSSGEILIDGVNIKDIKISDVHNLVGYVPQSHILFRKTVDENILIGNLLASEKQIVDSMKVSDFFKDIDNLSEGRHTMVGELGQSISGGQKQRLSIARALVKQPDILILDDSLSAVDALTEKEIIENLKVSRANKTNIIVAHRFSAIYAADKIIVIEDGKISDIGTHKELISYDNWYHRQYLEQLKDSRGDDNA